MSLAGQTALVTGGSKGIGKAICLALAKEGANVVIAARNESKIKEMVNKLKAMGSKAMAVQADVQNEEDVRRLISMTIDKCGRLIFLSTTQVWPTKRSWKIPPWKSTKK